MQQNNFNVLQMYRELIEGNFFLRAVMASRPSKKQVALRKQISNDLQPRTAASPVLN